MIDIKSDLVNKVNDVIKIVSDYSKRVDTFDKAVQDLEFKKKCILKEISILEEKTKQAKDENSLVNVNLKKKSEELEWMKNIYNDKLDKLDIKIKEVDSLREDLIFQKNRNNRVINVGLNKVTDGKLLNNSKKKQ